MDPNNPNNPNNLNNPNNPNNPNKFHINFPRGQGPNQQVFENDPRAYNVDSRSAYPTTPSTFPQPAFQPPPQQQQQQHQGFIQSQIRTPQPGDYQQGGAGGAAGGQGGGGYFANTQAYQAQQPQYGQQPQYAQQQQQAPQQFQQPQVPSNQPFQGQNFNNQNDPTAGLTTQFQNQNLGGQPRQGSPFGRQSPVGLPSGPRPAGNNPQQGFSGGFLRPGGPGQQEPQQQQMPAEDEVPPEQDFDKYSSNVGKRVIGLHVHVQSFFKDNISRARERNVRSKELEALCNNPRTTMTEKDEAQRKLLVKETEHLRHLRTIESPNNYVTRKVIGKGAFGEVKLVQRRSDNKIYALKCLVKAEMFKKDQLAHVRAERDILAEADSPWVVTLHTTFQDQTFLYMLMEFLPGGDLMTMLIKYETFSPDIARFYMAEILLAIEAVHKLGFIHRDIKPDNILLDRGGHLKLTDFGLSTGFHRQHEASYYQNLLRGHSSSRRDNRNSIMIDQINLTVTNRGQINNWRKSRRTMAYSTVGTPDYIAPEIFSGQGYSFSCDWWSLGAIMYESVIGWPPFCADDPHDTYRKIVDWRHTLYIPDDLPQPLDPRAEHLIRSLLCDTQNRIGHAGGPAGAQDIKQHPYFAGVNWDDIRKMRAPFEPHLKDPLDTEYFPIDDIDQTDHTEAWRAQAAQLSEEHAAEMTLPFIGYTFRRYGGRDDD